MRKIILALATTAAFAVAPGYVSAGPITPPQLGASVTGEDGSAVHKADWYCGPRCHYWRQRRWEESRAYRYHPPYHPYYRYGYYDRYGYYHY